MRMVILGLVMVAVMMLGIHRGSAAQAPQQEPVVDALAKVSAAMVDKVQAILAQQQNALGCKEFSLMSPDRLYVLAEPADRVSGAGGRWVVRYPAAACGRAALGSVEFDARGKKGVAINPLVPGETLADPDLQRDVVKSFGMTVTRAMPKCTDEVNIRSTKVLVYPAKPDVAWREVWIGTACGRDIGQAITFTPNGKGVGFSMAVTK